MGCFLRQTTLPKAALMDSVVRFLYCEESLSIEHCVSKWVDWLVRLEGKELHEMVSEMGLVGEVCCRRPNGEMVTEERARTEYSLLRENAILMSNCEGQQA